VIAVAEDLSPKRNAAALDLLGQGADPRSHLVTIERRIEPHRSEPEPIEPVRRPVGGGAIPRPRIGCARIEVERTEALEKPARRDVRLGLADAAGDCPASSLPRGLGAVLADLAIRQPRRGGDLPAVAGGPPSQRLASGVFAIPDMSRRARLRWPLSLRVGGGSKEKPRTCRGF
jgi:hypothetical protein